MALIDIKKWSIDECKHLIYTHEPRQVELFNQCINNIISETPTMIELGAGEGLYSLIFNEFFVKKNKQHKNICVELHGYKIEQIKEHSPSAITYEGYLGELNLDVGDVTDLFRINENTTSEVTLSKQKRIYLKDIFEQNKLSAVDILHADVQGVEDIILNELKDANLINKIRYYFISTHSHLIDKHKICTDFIKEYIPNNHTLFNDPRTDCGGGYGDGLIVIENLNFLI